VIADAVEPCRLLAERDLAPLRHICDDGGSRGQCLIPRCGGSGNGGEQVGRCDGATPEVDRAEHPSRVTAGQPRVTPETSVR